MPSSIFQKGALFVVAALVVGCSARAPAGPPTRVHTATKAQPVIPLPATRNAGANVVAITQTDTVRHVTGNGIPDHLVGVFPNAGNPNRISEQSVSFTIPRNPKRAATAQSAEGWMFGGSVNGVVLDPFAGEFWQGNRRSGWNYDALGGAVALGVDANLAHVQPQGTYHYHGVPFGLLELLGYDANQHSPLVGYAADGYPIYALTGILDGSLSKVSSSYALKSGDRPGGSAPDGAYDGAFVQDYEYVAGLGNLDACNGAFTQSAEFPNGSYAYFLTEEFPFVPRCFTGTPNNGFRKGP